LQLQIFSTCCKQILCLPAADEFWLKVLGGFMVNSFVKEAVAVQVFLIMLILVAGLQGSKAQVRHGFGSAGTLQLFD
jgi:hypothetical protein